MEKKSSFRVNKLFVFFLLIIVLLIYFVIADSEGTNVVEDTTDTDWGSGDYYEIQDTEIQNLTLNASCTSGDINLGNGTCLGKFVIGANPGDGHIAYSIWQPGEPDQSTHDTAHDAATGSGGNNASTTVFISVTKTWNGWWNYYIFRGFFPFDTSSLPDDSEILEADFHFNVNSQADTPTLSLVESTQADNTELVKADYDQAGSINNPTKGADDVTITGTGWSSFSLNDTGISWIDKKGYASLAVREEDYDVSDVLHSTYGGTNVHIRSKEYTGTSSDPYLNITYRNYATYGNYTSGVFGSGESKNRWDNISWGGIGWLNWSDAELPDNQEDELATRQYGANMTENRFLIHLNNDSVYGETDAEHTLDGVNDFSGRDNDCMIGNGSGDTNPKWVSNGKFDGAYVFDGINDTLVCGNDSSISLNKNITISAWIRANASLTSGNNFIVSKGTVGGAVEYQVLLTDDGYAKFHYGQNTLTGTTELNDSKWHHIVGKSNKTKDLHLYVDGVLIDSSTGFLAPSKNAHNLTIGSRSDFQENRFFNGTIDEVAIWNRTLSDSEIMNIYKRGILRLNIQTRTSEDNSTFTAWSNNQSNPSAYINMTKYLQYRVEMTTENVMYSPSVEWVNISYFKDSINPNVTIDHPTNTSYNISNIDLNWTLGEPNKEWCGYSFNGNVNETEIYSSTNLTQVGFYKDISDLSLVSDLFVKENYAYIVADGSTSMTIINVTDPTNPTYLNKHSTANQEGSDSIYIYEGFAYIVSDLKDTLTIVNISNISNMNSFSFTNGSSLDNCSDVTSDGSYAYITSSRQENLTMIIVNVTNKSDLEQIAEVIDDTDLNGEFSVISFYEHGIFYLDSYVYSTHYYWDTAISPTSTFAKLRVINVTDIANSVETDEWYAVGAASPPPGSSDLVGFSDVYVQGNYAYASDVYDSEFQDGGGNFTIKIFNVTDKNSISQISTFLDLEGYAVDSLYLSNYQVFYVSNSDSSLLVASMAENMTSLKDLSDFQNGSSISGANSVHVSGNYAYIVAEDWSTLTIVNVTKYQNNITFSNLDVGGYEVTISCNDTHGNWNTTTSVSFAVTSCACQTTRDWVVDCSQNCIITEDCVQPDYNMIVNGNGVLSIRANIFTEELRLEDTCSLDIDDTSGSLAIWGIR